MKLGFSHFFKKNLFCCIASEFCCKLCFFASLAYSECIVIYWHVLSLVCWTWMFMYASIICRILSLAARFCFLRYFFVFRTADTGERWFFFFFTVFFSPWKFPNPTSTPFSSPSQNLLLQLVAELLNIFSITEIFQV